MYEILANAAEEVLDFDLVAVDVHRDGELVQAAWSLDADTEGFWEVTPLNVVDEFAVRGDRLQQVFENLFRNAVEHGGGAVTVRVGVFDDENGFYVADDGRGIAAEEREAVFGHGYTTSDDGTGFGLPIVAEIVNAHGWSVAVADGEDGGARFEITGVELLGAPEQRQ